MRKKTTILAGVATLATLIAVVVYLVLGALAEPEGVILYFEFETAGGLHPGAPVRFAGVVVGVVEDIQPVEQGHCTAGSAQTWRVRLTTRVDAEKIAALHRDASAFLTTLGPLGQVYVEVDTGSLDAPGVEAEDTLCGSTLMRPEDHALRMRLSTESLKNRQVSMDELKTQVERLLVNSEPVQRAWKSQTPELIERSAVVGVRLAAIASHPLFGDDLKEEGALIVGEIERLDRKVQHGKRKIQKGVKAIDKRSKKTWAIWKEGIILRDDRIAALGDRLAAIQKDLGVLSGRVKDIRTSIGAMRSDKEIQNTVKGISMDLQRRFWKFLIRREELIQSAQ